MNNQGFTSGARCNYAQIPPKAPDGKYPDERKYFFLKKRYQKEILQIFFQRTRIGAFQRMMTVGLNVMRNQENATFVELLGTSQNYITLKFLHKA